MSKLLENRCAIITGASLGLGFEIAKRYVEAGASLMICARNEAQLDTAAMALRRLAGHGQTVLALRRRCLQSRKRCRRSSTLR